MRGTLKSLRLNRGISQEDMARALDIPMDIYVLWEKDFGSVKAHDGERMARILGVKLDDIIIDEHE